MSITISQLFTYPVKSLKGISLNTMEIDRFGPKWDRRFMLVDEIGRFVTQRKFPLMSQISAIMDDGNLVISFKQQSLTIHREEFMTQAATQAVTVWGDQVMAVAISHDINAWLSDILKKTVQLCFIPDTIHRQVDTQFVPEGVTTSFSDGFPFLIISDHSVASLSEQLAFELSVERFRPNIVVTGCEAFAEDAWKRIEVGGIEFDIVKPCSRCVIPTIDLVTGEKQPEVMQVMLKQRKQGNNVMMGQNAFHRQLGQLQIGQAVNIIE